MLKTAQGTCLCKAVTVSFPLEKEVYDVCHCGMCRKWGGGPAMTVEAGTKIQFQGEEFITRYNSSDWAERGFCKQCGTHLFYHLKGVFYNVPMGLLENTENFKFHLQIFTDWKPKHYEFANKTVMMTEAEVLSKFNS